MPAKFQISYQGTLDYFCGIYAVINAVGYACSSFRGMTSSEKEAFFRCFMKYLIDNNFLKINFANLAWKPRRKKKTSKETQLMKEGIFFISAKQLS